MSCRTRLLDKGLWSAAIAGLLVAAMSPLSAETAPADSWDQYRLLVQRNIFRRDRRRPLPRGPSPGPTMRAVRDSDRDIVLTGVGRRDGVFVAFLENTATGVTTRVPAGQAVGKGKIQAITLDGVDYERGGSLNRIEIGHALQGGRFVRETIATGPGATTRPGGPPLSTTRPATAASGPAAQTSSAASGGEATSSDIADILERMRQRREQELRK